MKKTTLTIIIALLLVSAMCFTTSASAATYTYELGNVTVIFDENSTLDEQTQKAIAEYLVYGGEQPTTYGLWCTLFGHSYETQTVITITHCVYDTEPRCLKEIYDVDVCTRCEHTVSELIGSAYITCCPEE